MVVLQQGGAPKSFQTQASPQTWQGAKLGERIAPSPHLLPGCHQEATGTLLSSGASLVLEISCQFIFAAAGSEAHFCVYGMVVSCTVLPIVP